MSEPPAAAPQRSYMHHIREDAWGIFVITKREFIANIKSFRSIVMVIILALIMVGASMGFASLSSGGEADITIMTQLIAMDPDGQANDLVVFVHEAGTYEPVPDIDCVLMVEVLEIPEYMGRTDQRGIWTAKDLTPGFHKLLVDLPGDDPPAIGMGASLDDPTGVADIYVRHNSTVPHPSLGVAAYVVDISGNDRRDDVAVHVVDIDGAPVEGAQVTIGDLTNDTGANGVTTFIKAPRGEHMVTATDGIMTGLAMVNVTHDRTETDPFFIALEGPDAVLRLVAAIAIGLVGPIYAIVLCFDSVFRERISGSIDYLLCRPMGRRAVLLGKFTGVLAALMVPITAVALLGVGAISWSTGTSPTGELVWGFLVYTVFLIATFVLLQMIFSTVAKTTGTAILSGIGIWIFFFMLFDLILLLVANLSGLEGQEASMFFNRASFLNPISIYGMAIGQLGNDDPIAGVPGWAPATALVMLAVILLVAAMEIFTRRVTE